MTRRGNATWFVRDCPECDAGELTPIAVDGEEITMLGCDECGKRVTPEQHTQQPRLAGRRMAVWGILLLASAALLLAGAFLYALAGIGSVAVDALRSRTEGVN